MKKLRVIFSILAALAVLGCTSTSGGAKSGASSGAKSGKTASGVAEPYVVDLKLLPFVRNVKPFTKPTWEDHFIPIPPLPNFDYTKYSRVTITVKFLDAQGNEIPPADSMSIVTLINDAKGDWRGPQAEPGPNTPLKEFNVGGYSGLVNKDKGVRVRLTQQPEGILFERNPGAPQAYTELTGLIFHNGNYSSEK